MASNTYNYRIHPISDPTINYEKLIKFGSCSNQRNVLDSKEECVQGFTTAN